MQYKIVATDKDDFTRIVAYTYNEDEVVSLINEWRGKCFEEVGARHEMGWLLRVGGEAGDITVRYEVISELGTSECTILPPIYHKWYKYIKYEINFRG